MITRYVVDLTAVRLSDGRRETWRHTWHVATRGNVKGYGRPNARNLKRFTEGWHASTLPGGTNAHLTPWLFPSSRIVDQHTNRVVVEYAAPLFQEVH